MVEKCIDVVKSVSTETTSMILPVVFHQGHSILTHPQSILRTTTCSYYFLLWHSWPTKASWGHHEQNRSCYIMQKNRWGKQIRAREQTRTVRGKQMGKEKTDRWKTWTGSCGKEWGVIVNNRSRQVKRFGLVQEATSSLSQSVHQK